METSTKQLGDRADLVFTGSIPDGEYNRDVEIRATADGLEIDEYLIVPWKWVLEAAMSQSSPELFVALSLAKTAQPKFLKKPFGDL